MVIFIYKIIFKNILTMALDFVGNYGLVDDGLVSYIPKDRCGITSNQVVKIVKDMLSSENVTGSVDIKEEGDVLYVNNKPVMTDDYVTGGTYSKGKVTLTTNDGKEAVINDLPDPEAIDKEDVEKLFDKE